MAELTKLPGAARKTANIVLGNAFGKVEGIAVDTHVRRLSQRLGLTTQDDPIKIEQDLMKLVPKDKWFQLSYLFIEHGRAVCKAPVPRCGECVLADLCPSAKLWLR
jgi:endonuclease-3